MQRHKALVGQTQPWVQNPPPRFSSKIVIHIEWQNRYKRLNPNTELAFESLKAGGVNEDISRVSAGYTAPIYR